MNNCNIGNILDANFTDVINALLVNMYLYEHDAKMVKRIKISIYLMIGYYFTLEKFKDESFPSIYTYDEDEMTYNPTNETTTTSDIRSFYESTILNDFGINDTNDLVYDIKINHFFKEMPKIGLVDYKPTIYDFERTHHMQYIELYILIYYSIIKGYKDSRSIKNRIRRFNNHKLDLFHHHMVTDVFKPFIDHGGDIDLYRRYLNMYYRTMKIDREASDDIRHEILHLDVGHVTSYRYEFSFQFSSIDMTRMLINSVNKMPLDYDKSTSLDIMIYLSYDLLNIIDSTTVRNLLHTIFKDIEPYTLSVGGQRYIIDPMFMVRSSYLVTACHIFNQFNTLLGLINEDRNTIDVIFDVVLHSLSILYHLSCIKGDVVDFRCILDRIRIKPIDAHLSKFDNILYCSLSNSINKMEYCESMDEKKQYQTTFPLKEERTNMNSTTIDFQFTDRFKKPYIHLFLWYLIKCGSINYNIDFKIQDDFDADETLSVFAKENGLQLKRIRKLLEPFDVFSNMCIFRDVIMMTTPPHDNFIFSLYWYNASCYIDTNLLFAAKQISYVYPTLSYNLYIKQFNGYMIREAENIFQILVVYYIFFLQYIHIISLSIRGKYFIYKQNKDVSRISSKNHCLVFTNIYEKLEYSIQCKELERVANPYEDPKQRNYMPHTYITMLLKYLEFDEFDDKKEYKQEIRLLTKIESIMRNLDMDELLIGRNTRIKRVSIIYLFKDDPFAFNFLFIYEKEQLRDIFENMVPNNEQYKDFHVNLRKIRDMLICRIPSSSNYTISYKVFQWNTGHSMYFIEMSDCKNLYVLDNDNKNFIIGRSVDATRDGRDIIEMNLHIKK